MLNFTQTDFTDPHVLVVRRRSTPRPLPAFGYEIIIPALELPASPPGHAPNVAEVLGWSDTIPAGLRHTRLRKILVHGVIAPSQLERRFVSWLGETLEVTVEWADPQPPSASTERAKVIERLRSVKPWSGAGEVPAPFVLRRASTRRGEARAAARGIRKWLVSQSADPRARAEAADQVLVLVPDESARSVIVAREFDRADLPFRVCTRRRVLDTGIGRWTLSVAELAGWRDTSPRRVEVLEAVFLDAYGAALHMGVPVQGFRRSALELLAAIRRPALTTTQFRDHVLASVRRLEQEERERAARAPERTRAPEQNGEATETTSPNSPAKSQSMRDAGAFILALGEALESETAAALASVLQAVKGAQEHTGFGVLATLHARSNAAAPTDAAAQSLAAYRSILDALSQEALDAPPADAALDPLRTRVTELLDQRSLVDEQDVQHGITILPYSGYDGRGARYVVALGLEEGAFPQVPALPTTAERTWLSALGLLDHGLESWLVSEVDRQLEVLCELIQRTTGPFVFSHATESGDGRVVYPGAALSLLTGGWTDDDWNSGGRVEYIRRIDEQPARVADATNLRDLQTFAGSEQAASLESSGLPSLDWPALQQRAKRALDVAAERAPRAPRENGAVPCGPHTGRLPAPTLPARSYSATELEVFGLCPYKHFASRVLKLRPLDSAEALPDPLETGNALHNALEHAAKAVALSASRTLDFRAMWTPALADAPAGLSQEAERFLAQLDAQVAAEFDQIASDHPTLSRPALVALHKRWNTAFRGWLEKHAKAGHELIELDEEALIRSNNTLGRASAKAQKSAASIAALEQLREAVRRGEATTKAQWQAFAGESSLTKVSLGKAQSEWRKLDAPDLDAFFGPRIEVQRAEAAAKAQELTELLANARESRVACVLPVQARAELEFGRERPLRVSADGLEVPVRGKIDRVDIDPETGCFAIRDWKSGGSKSAKALEREYLAGHQLQLTLYSAALETLLQTGLETALETELETALETKLGNECAAGSLEFVRSGSSASLNPSGLSRHAKTAQGDELTWSGVTGVWVRHAAESIAKGHFDLLPSRCPKAGHRGVSCDFADACAYQPEHRNNFADARPTLFPLAGPSDGPSSAAEAVGVQPPDANASAADDDAHARHEEALERIADLDQNLVVSAGAGTGKTYALVVRYLTALAERVSPLEITAVTFTRRAAGEMVHRIRQALLSHVEGPMARPAQALKSDPEALRRTVLLLSAAPITTIDAFAFRLLSELHELRGEVTKAQSLAVLDPSVADEDLRLYLSERVYEDWQAGDPLIQLLSETLPPAQVLTELTSIAGGVSAGAPTNASDIIETWDALALRVADSVRGALRAEGATRFHELLDAPGVPFDKFPEGVEARLSAAAAAYRTLAGEEELSVSALRTQLALLADVPSSSADFGRPRSGSSSPARALYEWVGQSLLKGSLAKLAFAAGLPESVGKGLQGWVDAGLEGTQDLALAAEAALTLGKRYRTGYREQLHRAGRYRYADVESAVVEALQAPSIGKDLAARTQAKHLLVDESQDTSERQVRLLRRVAELTGAKELWVGDPKQSIYRFRGAEFDVFEALHQNAQHQDAQHQDAQHQDAQHQDAQHQDAQHQDAQHQDAQHQNALHSDAASVGAQACELQVNRRSRPPLLAAINRLFSAVFASTSGGVHLDPGADPMAYPPLVPPRDAGPVHDTPPCPAVELHLASPESNLATLDEDSPESEHHATLGEPTHTELAAVKRTADEVRARLGSFDAQAEKGAVVAVLVGSWQYAARMRALLEQAGLRAAIEGGRGLVETAEVQTLCAWLRHHLRPDGVTLLATLKSPGIDLPDGVLYCMRHGWGFGDDAFPSIRANATPDFDAQAAADAWAKAVPEADPSSLVEALAPGETAIREHRRMIELLRTHFGHEPTAEVLRRIADELGLWALWRAQGPQAIANVETFLDLVENWEAANGISPRASERMLGSIRKTSDPASSNLEADAGASVVVTTFWQAKGREWPVVVLPEVHRQRIRSEASGFTPTRIVLPETGARWVPEARQTANADPFKSETTWVSQLVDLYRKSQDRAEQRRLLYVAMTRAKEALIITGAIRAEPNGSMSGRLFGADKDVFTLNGASSWSKLLYAAAGVYMKDEQPSFDENAVWSAEFVKLVSAVDTANALVAEGILRRPDDAASAESAESAESASDGSSAESASDGSSAFPHPPTGACLDLTPIESPRVPWSSPSAAPAPAAVPRASILTGTKGFELPASPFSDPMLEGTVFHALMEHWCFGANAENPDAALDALLASLGGAESDAQRAYLREIVTTNRAELPKLWQELSAAAAAGKVFHEPIARAEIDGVRYEGRADLVWEDAHGRGLLDYKTNKQASTRTEAEHYGQAQIYAKAIGATKFGIWYVAEPRAAVWDQSAEG